MDTEHESIEEYCENLRKEIVDLSIKFQDHNIKVTMSGGVASSDEIDNLEDLINLADERLYEAKVESEKNNSPKNSTPSNLHENLL